MEGTARSIGTDTGAFATSDDDIRDMFLRVTSVAGFDHFLAVSWVAEAVSRGEFGIDD
jgi:hypothetical protein